MTRSFGPCISLGRSGDLEDQAVPAESAETVFWLRQHYTQGNVNMAGKPLVCG